MKDNRMLDRIFERLRENNIIIALLAAFIGYLAYRINLVIVVFFIAFILTVILLPPVNFLMKRGIKRGFAILIIAVALTILAVLFGYGLFPPLVAQLIQLVDRLPTIMQSIPFLSQFQFNESFFSILQSHLENFQGYAITLTTSAVSFGITLSGIIVLTLYMLADYPRLKESTVVQFGQHQDLAREVFRYLEKKLGGWMRGQLLLSLTVTILFLIAYLTVGLPAAIPLALLAGAFEIIPVIGQVIAAIPAALIALTVSFKFFIIVIIIYTIIQFIEAQILAPRVMSRAAHLHPVAVIFALLAGGELAGFIGILLAVPVMLFFVSIYEAIHDANEKKKIIKIAENDTTI